MRNIQAVKRAMLPILLMAVGLLFCPSFSAFTSLMARDLTIKATAGPGGSISPSGDVKVKKYYSQNFTITADDDYEIDDVLVDGKSVGAVSTYLFTFVTKKHTIAARFKPRIFIITASAGEGGEISPSGVVRVNQGDNQIFDIEAHTGYEIEDVVVNEESQGAISTYAFTAISSDHAIAAIFERMLEVLDVSIPNIPMKIGDVVMATLRVSDDGGSPYSFISGSIGGYPLGNFQRISATEYRTDFSIFEGGNAFDAAEDIPVSDLVISNGERNSIAYDLPLVQDNDPIDTQVPVLTQIEVPSLAVGVGGLVKLTLTADGTAYLPAEGTVVNGISLSTSRLSFTELSEGLYELSFVVQGDDSKVAPGTLEASIVLRDEAGNVGSGYQIIEPNTLEIYTALPEATLVGPLQICEGEEVQLSLHLRGRSPWSFDLTDGTETTTYSDIIAADYKISVAPVQSTTYMVSSVRDVNGVENAANGDFLLTVNEVSDVEIINLAAGYDVEGEPVKLEANIPGGTFSGPGVISATGYFHPDVADTVSSPHTIYYTYTSNNGCVSADSALVYVLGDQGAILIPAKAFCKDEDPFDVGVLNVPGTGGSFRLLGSASEPVMGLTDHGNNTATIVPDSLSTGSYTIEYQYFDLISHSLSTVFVLESVEQPQILIVDTSFCQNEAPFVLQSNLPNVIFEGQGVSGNSNVGFTFNPSEAEPGSIWITCIAESQSACRASSRKSIDIKFAPRVMFVLRSECMPEGGEMVSFENQTENKSAVETWIWDFGDPGSGEDNHSNLPDPMWVLFTNCTAEPGVKQSLIMLKSATGLLSIRASIEYRPPHASNELALSMMLLTPGCW